MRIVFFSAVRFDSILSGRTKQMALEIVADGHEVWFVEMPALRNFRLPPLQTRKENGINIITLLPFPLRFKLINTPVGAVWRQITTAYLKRKFGHFQDVHCIVSNPWWTHLLKTIPFKTLSYDCIDHVSVHSHKKGLDKMIGWEKELLDNCDNIFIIKDVMKTSLPDTSDKNVLLVPNGVPADWLKIESDKTSRTERARIGFVGSLYEWIDQELVCSVARACPEMDFVLVGPTRREVPVDSMREVENITIEPPISFGQVPACIQSFDVCMIPFKNDIVSNCADPLKLYEYLSLAKPVVTSVNFNTEAPIYTAATETEFVSHIITALNEQDRRQKYRSFASQYTWLKQAKKITDALHGEEQQC